MKEKIKSSLEHFVSFGLFYVLYSRYNLFMAVIFYLFKQLFLKAAFWKFMVRAATVLAINYLKMVRPAVIMH